MSDPEKLREEANKLANSGGGFFSKLFGGNKLDEACEKYTQAGSRFKIDQKWSSAGECYETAANIQLNKLENKHESAQNFVEAGNCFRKSDPKRASDCLKAAIEVYIDLGRANLVAKQHVTMAEIWEVEPEQLVESIEHYRKASAIFRGEEQQSQANKCDLKAAQMLATNKSYQEAVQLFEQVAQNACESSLLKYSAKEYFFKAALCHFCIDTNQASIAVERYESNFPSFTDTRECQLLKSLIKAAEECKIDDYTDAVKKYDSMSRLDQWYTAILLAIKNRLADDPTPDFT